jgi:acetylglutamate/LysW-gamma-L-alpha-aminoadipate kinase
MTDVIVCKIGGSAGVDLDAVCEDVASLVRQGRAVVLVHGGSDATNKLARQLGREPRFVTSPSGMVSRHTDRADLEILVMACRGGVNSALVERLARRGVRAIGLSGLDGGLWRGPRKTAVRAVEDGRVRVLHDGYTGSVRAVDAALLRGLLGLGLLPVIGPPGCSDDGEAINVDADRAAAATAAALGARELVILSNVPGLLADPEDPASLIARVDAASVPSAEAAARGRMRVKVLAAREAMAAGVRVVLADARVSSPLRRALAGDGTVFEAAPTSAPSDGERCA